MRGLRNPRRSRAAAGGDEYARVVRRLAGAGLGLDGRPARIRTRCARTCRPGPCRNTGCRPPRRAPEGGRVPCPSSSSAAGSRGWSPRAPWPAGSAGGPRRAGDRMGGKVSTERVGGFTHEARPRLVPDHAPGGGDLVRELGLGDELVGTKDPRAVYIRHRGKLVRCPRAWVSCCPTRFLPSPGRACSRGRRRPRKAGTSCGRGCSTSTDVAVGTYLRRPARQPTRGPPGRAAVGGVYGTPIDELSLDAVVPQLRAAERTHAAACCSPACRTSGDAPGRRGRASAARASGQAGAGRWASSRPCAAA